MAVQKPVGIPFAVMSVFPENVRQDRCEEMVANGVTPLQGVDDALIALGAAVRCGELRRQIEAEGGTASLALWDPRSLAGEPMLLDEWRGKAMLRKFGLQTPDGAVVAAEEAPEVATRHGFPVAVKVLAAELTHKSRVGGVALNLWSEQEVAAAVARMSRSVEIAIRGQSPQRFLVERMIDDVIAELIVGVKRDPIFGYAMVIGAGGTGVETLRDFRTLLLPVGRETIRRAILELNAWTGLGEMAQRCLEPVVLAIEAVVRLAEALRDTLVECDINPLLVRAGDALPVCADAVVRLCTRELTIPSAGNAAGSPPASD